MSASTPKPRDLISRGDYSSSPAGKSVFFLIRSLDPLLQYSILAHGLGASLFTRFGLRILPPALSSQTGIALIDNLGLSPYRLVLLGMAVGSAVKHDIWISVLAQEQMSVQNAVTIGVFNSVFNSMNSYAFLLSAASLTAESTFPQTELLVAGSLYVVGLLTELVAEVQRKRFKADPKNQGKVYTGGLWKFARHINYTGYVLWRGGYALAGGGYIMGAVVGGFFLSDFLTRGIPVLDEYCGKRYGVAWEKFKKDTPYKLIPYVY